MRSTPSVTVVTCVYNGAKYLQAAIDSILGQTLTNFEYVIIDDGSTDETAQILGSYTDRRIRVLRNSSNIGLTASLNRGWKVGTSPFIAILDSDDWAYPNRLEQQVGYLKNNHSLALLGCDVEVINGEGEFVRFKRFPKDFDRLKAGLVTQSSIDHSCFVLRRTMLEKIGGYDEKYKYGQDFDLQWRLSMVGSIESIPEFLIKYRQGHSGSISSSKRDLQFESGRQIAIRNLLELMNGDARLDREGAGHFYDALYLTGPQWENGDARRYKALCKRLLSTKGWQTIWGPRLNSLANKLVEWNHREAMQLCWSLAMYSPLTRPSSLLATFARTILPRRHRKKMEYFIAGLK